MDKIDDIVLALGAEQVVKLTGLTMRQLASWDAAGFFKPEYADEHRRANNSRVYSFRDVVGLRTISTLMHAHGVPVPHLKEVARKLASYTDRPWSELKLRVWDRRVQFDEPETGAARDVVSGQYVLLPIIDVINEVRRGVEALRSRAPEEIGRFEKHRHVAGNRLVLAGTRVPVASVLDYLREGHATADIIRNYPNLTEQDVEAVRKRGTAALAA